MPPRSEAEFVALYRANYGALVGFFRRRLDDADSAEDLAAESFRIAWIHWQDGTAPNRAWLYQVARNLIGDQWRRETRDRQRTTELIDAGDPARDEQRATDVRAVLAGLAVVHRDVLALTYWDGLSAAEVARVLGTTRSNVWVRLHRARAEFAAAWRSDDRPITTPAPVKEAL